MVSSLGLLWCYFLLSNQRIKINNVSFSRASLFPNNQTHEASQSVHPKGVTVVFGNISVCIRQLLFGKWLKLFSESLAKFFWKLLPLRSEMFAFVFINLYSEIFTLVLRNFHRCIRRISFCFRRQPMLSDSATCIRNFECCCIRRLETVCLQVELHSAARKNTFRI